MSDQGIDRLEAAVASASSPTHMSSKAEVIDYYKDQYGSRWSSHAAAALAGTPDAKGKPYSYRSAIRQFQGGRESSTPRTKAAQERWRDLGEKLPPTGRKAPAGGYKVTFVGRVKVSDGRRRGKKGQKSKGMRGDGWANAAFTREITGEEAAQFAQSPNYEYLFGKYFVNWNQNPVTDWTTQSIRVTPL